MDCCSISSKLSGAGCSLRFILLPKESLPLLKSSGLGGGGVGQNFKPFCNKLVFDWGGGGAGWVGELN